MGRIAARIVLSPDPESAGVRRPGGRGARAHGARIHTGTIVDPSLNPTQPAPRYALAPILSIQAMELITGIGSLCWAAAFLHWPLSGG